MMLILEMEKLKGLKLQANKDGKLDITFADDADIGNGKVKRNTFRTSSSAGRRKTREFHQSHVLPKRRPQVKASKSLDVKQQTAKETTANEPVSSRKGTRWKQDPGKHGTNQGKDKKGQGANPGKNREPGKQGANTDAGVITQSQLNTILQALKGADDNVLASLQVLNRQNLPNNENGHVTKTDKPAPDVPPVGYRSTDYDKWARLKGGNQEDTGKSAQPQTSETPPAPLTQRSSQHAAMASSFAIGAPGLVTYDQEQQKRDRHKQWLADLDEQVQAKKRQQSEEKRSPGDRTQQHTVETSRPGQSTMESHHGTLLDSRHQPQAPLQPHAMASSFAIGAPGVVAYDLEEDRRAKQRQYLIDIQDQMRQQQLKRTSEDVDGTPLHSQTARSIGQPVPPGVQLHQPVAATQQQDVGFTSAEQSDNPRLSFGRKNFEVKDTSEIDKMEREREKHLQHQRAIQEQVEEKRKKKIEERERKIQEEQEEQRKLAAEREQLNRQYEDELRKQREKEEAERERLEALQERVREAYELAQREKLEGKIRKLKASGHDASKLEERHHIQLDNHSTTDTRESSLGHLDLRSISSGQDIPISSTRSTRENRPVVNWGSSPEEEAKLAKHAENSSRKQSRRKLEKKGSDGKSSHDEGGSKSCLDAEPRLSSEQSDEGRTSRRNCQRRVGERGKENAGNVSSRKATKDRSGRKEDVPMEGEPKARQRAAKTNQDRVAVRQRKKSDSSDIDESNRGYHSTKESERDDAVVPYIRTTTMTLKPEVRENDLSESEVEQVGHVFHIQRTPTVQLQRDATADQDHFTPRQQQILDQLQALRKGLMEKQREHERDASLDY